MFDHITKDNYKNGFIQPSFMCSEILRFQNTHNADDEENQWYDNCHSDY